MYSFSSRLNLLCSNHNCKSITLKSRVLSFPLRSTLFPCGPLCGLPGSVSPQPPDPRESQSYLCPRRAASSLPRLLLSCLWFWSAEEEGQSGQQRRVLVQHMLRKEPDVGEGRDSVLRHTGSKFSPQLLKLIQQFNNNKTVIGIILLPDFILPLTEFLNLRPFVIDFSPASQTQRLFSSCFCIAPDKKKKA